MQKLKKCYFNEFISIFDKILLRIYKAKQHFISYKK